MIRLALSLLLLVGCTRIPPGYVGIKVNMYGSQKGVADFPLQTGRVTESLSPELMQYEALQKWDGILPKVTGETIPFIQVD